jgi:hypothetical protein
LCDSTGQTFSLLPHQLIPYHQYTIDAIIGTLMSVCHFQTLGQQGYHGACLSLDPDCLVTPYLIYTWTVLILNGFVRGYPVLQDTYPLSTMGPVARDRLVKTICLYIKRLSDGAKPHRRCMLTAVSYYAGRTGNFLFGTPSGSRIRSP